MSTFFYVTSQVHQSFSTFSPQLYKHKFSLPAGTSCVYVYQFPLITFSKAFTLLLFLHHQRMKRHQKRGNVLTRTMYVCMYTAATTSFKVLVYLCNWSHSDLYGFPLKCSKNICMYITYLHTSTLIS